ncbi:MAG: SO2930 family diheme c-type cytochrome [Pseudomonadota bacterium]|nr:SO2930 family diheme c-type cytochrome [Pseudomonadota bacterium]
MNKHFWRCSIIAASFTLILGCSDSPPVFYASDNPQRLSDWNLFTLSSTYLIPSSEGLVFRPANQLFTDYAHKLRTLWIPDGVQAMLVDGEIDYPVGTVLSKTFYYPTDSQGIPILQSDSSEPSVNLLTNKLIETRLLVRRSNGWEAFPYVWNNDQTEAFLRVAGASTNINLKSDTENFDFVYFVPNENQCAGCHVTEHPDGEMHPLGAIASQLSSSFLDYQSQIAALVERGWLDQYPNSSSPISWMDENANINKRAQAYLNIHCGHCHNPSGAADTSALLLDGSHDLLVNMGVCKTPVAAGGGAGDMLYSIVPGNPDRSILLYRMESDELDEMMPELGRSIIHREGVNLIERWISEMPGSCPD